MPEAYIIEATRTPIGKKAGSLANHHPADLGGFVIRTLLERARVDPADIDDVVWGCLDQVGPHAGDIARTCWLVAGLPEHVPGVTVDRLCGSSQQAVHFAAQGVMSGTQDLVVAGGVQNMNMVPITISATIMGNMGHVSPTSASPGWAERYGDKEISQFYGAELMADRWNISRTDMEAYALESNRRALHAIENGYFKKEIAPVNGFAVDETPRAGTTMEKMAALKTIREGGRLTAAVASQIADGGAALLIASEAAVKRHGLKPRARIHHMSVRADDPIMMLSAPIPATRVALKKAGLKMSDIDCVEINEAFAPVPLAWMKELGADPAKVNVNGGAIALGHPLGATGARLMTTMLHELERTKKRYGLQTMCEGGGQANVTIIERL